MPDVHTTNELIHAVITASTNGDEAALDDLECMIDDWLIGPDEFKTLASLIEFARKAIPACY